MQATNPAAAAAENTQALVPPGIARRPRVLCVDDESGVLEGLRIHLQRQHDFFCASGGAEALELLQREDVDVIVSDMRMPLMDGAEFLRRASELRPDAARILLTGQADIESASRAVNQGQIFRFLLKPCPPKELLAAVSEGVRRHARTLSDRSSQQEQSRQLLALDDERVFLTQHDPLTRLPARELFLKRAERLLRHAQARGQRLGIMLLDLRNFSSLNETLGRGTCDAILRAVAARLREHAPYVEAVGRIGGDSFAVAVLDPQPSWEPEALLASPLCRPLDAPVTVGSYNLQLSATVGLSLFPEDGDDADGLLCNAEAAMKSARANGEKACAYTREMGAVLARRIKLESRLRDALKQAEFQLYYQPKIDLRSGKVCGAEGLLRWRNPEMGMVPPSQFVPVLEETGLITEVGAWALRQAVADRHRWNEEGLSVPPLAVNVSPMQLRADDFVEQTLAAIGDNAADAAGISLEITESMLMTGADETIGKLQRIREAGIDIAIDDFGTGYSSLAYLSRLPVSALKIDRSFVVRMGDSADTVSIVLAVISLARALGLKVIAEGVDSPEQLKFLRLLRCDEFQGFLFSQGLPGADFAEMLRQDRRMSLN